MTTVTAPPSRLEAWYRAARPRTLTATYVPLGLAAMLALQERVFELVPFVLALIGALFLQVAANLINEYYDYRRGAEDLKQSGQGMVIKQGVLTPQEVLIGAVVTVLAGVAIGLYLLTQSGPLLFWIGLGGVLVVIAYTAGPFPLAYNGLGEVAVFIFMGPVMVLGAWYVMARDFSPLPLWVGVPIGFTVAAILHANNIRDMESDRAVNKRTLALMLGLRGARIEYIVLMIGAYVAVVLMVIGRIMPPTVLIAAVTLPEALKLIRIVTTSTDNAQLHMAQGRTAKLHGALGLWLIIGWAVWLIVEQTLQSCCAPLPSP
ncbi:MAG: 1,4-dihydroxy-2-naphthoate octaprenyltransferase [Chloroflexota bacterium]|nr:1,4-dihydroxy-2-naphthoate octaprenyltransferase [Chloroflexota bacterium]